MSGTSYEAVFLSSLLFTVFVELCVLYLLIRIRHPKAYSPSQILFAGILPSLTTLPYLWFILPLFFIGHHTLYVWSGETFVTVIEALFLWHLLGIRIRLALPYSLVANGASFGLGYLFI